MTDVQVPRRLLDGQRFLFPRFTFNGFSIPLFHLPHSSAPFYFIQDSSHYLDLVEPGQVLGWTLGKMDALPFLTIRGQILIILVCKSEGSYNKASTRHSDSCCIHWRQVRWDSQKWPPGLWPIIWEASVQWTVHNRRRNGYSSLRERWWPSVLNWARLNEWHCSFYSPGLTVPREQHRMKNAVSLAGWMLSWYPGDSPSSCCHPNACVSD